MAKRGVRVVILCEDDAHWRFVRYVFLRLGFHQRELRVVPHPAGRGAADQWVQDTYPAEVRRQRRQAGSQQVGLLVMIDADEWTVDERTGQLADKLTQDRQRLRGKGECIVIWVPRRHIETWVAYLLGQPVNEEMDCKHLVAGADYRPPATHFVQLFREPMSRSANLLPSILAAFAEMERLPD